MAFRGKIHHDIRMLFLENPVNRLPVADVRFAEAEVRLLHNRRQCGEIAGVREFIDADYPVFGVLLQEMENEIATDEPRSARDNNTLHCQILLPVP